jgi:tRNA U34 5-methylaminomethyl-2-thiouridine-forming methyltransferase MnmC
LFNPTIGEHYHSAHGALQESKHVFINAGLKHAVEKDNLKSISILEVGFGTGLNYLLSLAYCEEHQLNLNYVGIEAFPLTEEVLGSTGYNNYVSPALWDNFIKMYGKTLISRQHITEHSTLEIPHKKLIDFKRTEKFDVLYYDAFSVQHQAEMWTNEMIAHACQFIKTNGIFISYAITGNLKRAVKSCGFKIEKLPGAPGKREMLRAIKE